jgi:beclin 1
MRQSYSYLSGLQFQIEEEEKKLKAAIEEAEKLYSEVSSEMKDLEIKSKQFEELEERLVSVLISNSSAIFLYGTKS